MTTISTAKRWPGLPILVLVLLATVGMAHAYDRDQRFSASELDNLLAPVALYPDALLSQVLMASTYPLDVVEAARWIVVHPGIDGAEAARRLERMDWDPSVQALVAFPDVLDRMNSNLEWTRTLGDAWLLQEAEVMDAIQRLRDEAYTAGHLQSQEYVQVHRDRELVIIEPSRRDLVFVPYYDPALVYGRWWRPPHHSFLWGAPAGFRSSHAVYWGAGVSVAPMFYFSAFHWPQRHIVIVDRKSYAARYSRGPSPVYLKDARRWHHNPVYRRGVEYRHPVTREHYRVERPQYRAPERGRSGSGDHRGQLRPGQGLPAGTVPRNREWQAGPQFRAEAPVSPRERVDVSSSANRGMAARRALPIGVRSGDAARLAPPSRPVAAAPVGRSAVNRDREEARGAPSGDGRRAGTVSGVESGAAAVRNRQSIQPATVSRPVSSASRGTGNRQSR